MVHVPPDSGRVVRISGKFLVRDRAIDRFDPLCRTQ
jgi:hypothetical protein